MRSLNRRLVGRTVSAHAIAVILGLIFGAGCSRAAEDQKSLQLEVIINKAPAGMIGSFVRFGDNRIGATAEELESLGLRPGPGRSPGEMVLLDDIPTMQYEYDERTQRIFLTVGDAGRKPLTFDLAGAPGGRLPRAQAGWGTVLNYDLLSSSAGLQNLSSSYFTGTSLSLDARSFSPYGTFEQSAIARAGPQQPADLIRLNSSFRYSDQDRMISYGAGDIINGGLAWSRPIRMGGLQAQSNFSLRPDLITAPLPTLAGSAAVPSTVDVYVNNIRTFSQDVGTGPFSVSNVPLISGAGNAELVIRDSAGHETRSTTPFYASASLLAPGLSSWSVEGGLPRLSYGSTSDVYLESPLGSATLRRGIYDGLTVEAHAEGGAGVANGGVGAVIKTGTIGVAAAAISGSSSSTGAGLQTYISYETRLLGIDISASSQRTLGTYDDLASATARLQNIAASGLPNLNGLFAYIPFTALPSSSSFAYAAGLYTSSRAPIALDRITFSRPMPLDAKASLSASFVHLQDAAGNLSDIVTGSYSRSLPYNASIFATVFRDLGTNKNTGVFAGLSMALGDSVSVSTGISRGQGGTTATVEAAKSLGPEPGSIGWRVRDAEGATPYREASAAYRSSYGTVQADVSQSASSAAGSLELRGSITTMGGGVFLSNWIDDGFAVVSTGAPGVEVLNENRSAGVTDSRGMLLIPTLRSYQGNKITIDPANLPVDAEIATTREIVAPADRAGVLVKFDVRTDTAAALVTFVMKNGSFVPAGAAGRIAGGAEFVVGYDGQAFIKNLAAVNDAEIEFASGQCHASFPFIARPGEQVQIPAIECR
jgi:outer membrane usher protein